MTIAVVAEKPSVGRDIARALGANQAGDGFLEGPNHVVTWAIGHLVALAQPHQIDPAWKRWDLETLPMLPPTWPLVVLEETRKQFEVVKKILRRSDVESIVCATDAGREGELIFRYIYDAAACKKPVQRLWISSLTDDAIRQGFRRLRPSRDYDGLADAARGRSRADWLVGMNLSRAYSLSLGEDFSVGRVQTPTLAMVAERELAIRAFVPEDYLEIRATFSPTSEAAAAEASRYEGVLLDNQADAAETKGAPEKPRRLPPDGALAKAIVTRVLGGRAKITKHQAETRKIPPPALYDLTELQRHANRLFGFSAQKTLDVAQSLYERHKLLSYPRTDSRHLSTDVAATLPAIVKAIEGPYLSHLAPGTGTRPLSRRFVDDTRVTDHHAIIPTTTNPQNASLTGDEKRIHDLVCRRLLEAWQPDLVETTTTVITEVASEEAGAAIRDRFRTSGTVIENVGWKALELGGAKEGPKKRKKRAAGEPGEDGEDERDEQVLPRGLREGQTQNVLGAKAEKKTTKPPNRFTEATLLTAMETAGKTVEEKELSDAMRDTGLGTPATRAAIIETLVKREYVIRAGKSLEATEKGIALVGAVHPYVKSAAMTGEWEARLSRSARGDGELGGFVKGIEAYVKYVVGSVQDGEVVGSLGIGEGGRPKSSPGGPPELGSFGPSDSGTHHPGCFFGRPPSPRSSRGDVGLQEEGGGGGDGGFQEEKSGGEGGGCGGKKVGNGVRSALVVSGGEKGLKREKVPEVKVERREVAAGTPLVEILRERFGFSGFGGIRRRFVGR